MLMVNTCNLDRPSENIMKLKSIKLPNADPNILFVLDSFDLVIYIADMDTYEILYINEYTRSLFGDIIGEKCYEVLQHLTEPCVFCTNEHIKQLNGKTYSWKFHNKTLNKTYLIKDKVIKWFNGKDARLEIAWDITNVNILAHCPAIKGGQECVRA
jgi:hypothetical protein